MADRENELGQSIGPEVAGWSTRDLPSREPMVGRFCRLEIVDPALHLEDLWEALSQEESGALFTYLPYGPFESIDEFRSWLVSTCMGDDPMFFSIIDAADDRAVGLAALHRMAPEMGSIEVAHLLFTPRLQQTTAATEAMYLMMRRAFSELGYRRYEWKCDSLNAPSRRAADRLGFTFEGIHRQAIVYKGRNRDTAWYSIVDSEWPHLEAAFVSWLDESNFGSDGSQRRSLASYR
jgi:RimJ/RimL family protein N-acetyltransferase